MNDPIGDYIADLADEVTLRRPPPRIILPQTGGSVTVSRLFGYQGA